MELNISSVKLILFTILITVSLSAVFYLAFVFNPLQKKHIATLKVAPTSAVPSPEPTQFVNPFISVASNPFIAAEQTQTNPFEISPTPAGGTEYENPFDSL